MIFKNKKVDQYCQKMYEDAIKENPMAFAVGKSIKLDKNNLPLDGEIKKLGLNVIDYRRPVENDYFISACGLIHKFNPRLSMEPLNSGYRFIVENSYPDFVNTGDDEEESSSTSVIPETEELDPVAERLWTQKKFKLPLFPKLLEENFGKVIRLNSDGIPIKGELDKLGLKVISYRVPTEKDVFISKQGEIVAMVDCFAFNYSTNHGFRFIIGVKTPASTTKKTVGRK